MEFYTREMEQIRKEYGRMINLSLEVIVLTLMIKNKKLDTKASNKWIHKLFFLSVLFYLEDLYMKSSNSLLYDKVSIMHTFRTY